jgi:uncharacterized protein YcbX
VPAQLIEIRRYPVKSMGGEAIEQIEVDARGLVGDRAYAVVDDEGRFAAGKDSRRFRRRDEVFHYAVATTPDGPVHVTRGGASWPAGSRELCLAVYADVRRPGRVAVGDPVRPS